MTEKTANLRSLIWRKKGRPHRLEFWIGASKFFSREERKEGSAGELNK